MGVSSPASKLHANVQDFFEVDLAPGDAYLRFKLTSDLTALLSMAQVEESLVVEAERITPVPNMPKAIIGMVSSRDQVFCVFDLAQALGLSSEGIAPQQYQIIVVQTNDEQPFHIGLAINRLYGVVRFTKENIQSSLQGVPPQIAPYLCGSVHQNKVLSLVIDCDRISAALTNLS